MEDSLSLYFVAGQDTTKPIRPPSSEQLEAPPNDQVNYSFGWYDRGIHRRKLEVVQVERLQEVEGGTVPYPVGFCRKRTTPPIGSYVDSAQV